MTQAASRSLLALALCALATACAQGARPSPRYTDPSLAPGRAVAAPPAPAYAPAPARPAYAPVAAAPRRMTFRFEVGDELSTAVWKEPELTVQQRIMADGTISPPLLKSMPVVGLTVDEVQARLEKGYAEYLKEPRVSVKVVGIHSDRAFVLGEVRQPQAVALAGPVTLVEAVTMAGGFAEEFADKRAVHLIRRGPGGEPLVARVDTRSILEGRMADVPLQRGDIVFVPARGVTEWARTVGQALSPLSTALGTAGAVVTVQQATR